MAERESACSSHATAAGLSQGSDPAVGNAKPGVNPTSSSTRPIGAFRKFVLLLLFNTTSL
jgi:hypothetical protein